MGRFHGGLSQPYRDDPLGRLGPQRLDARGTRLVAQQSIEPLLDKALLPAPNAGLGLPGSPHDFVRADPVGGQQHDLSPPDVLLRHVAVLNHGLEPTNIGGRDGEPFSSAHRADSHVRPPTGNPIRDSNVSLDPLANVPQFAETPQARPSTIKML